MTISPADAAEPNLAADDAIATVRTFMLSRLNAIPEQEPEAVLARITGTVFGEKPVRVPPGRFPKVRNRLAWLVVWRQVPEDAFDPPFHTPVSDEPVDYIVFVDAVTGERLYNVFAPLGPG